MNTSWPVMTFRSEKLTDPHIIIETTKTRVKNKNESSRQQGSRPAPLAPPYIRVRIRRFLKLMNSTINNQSTQGNEFKFNKVGRGQNKIHMLCPRVPPRTPTVKSAVPSMTLREACLNKTLIPRVGTFPLTPDDQT